MLTAARNNICGLAVVSLTDFSNLEDCVVSPINDRYEHLVLGGNNHSMAPLLMIMSTCLHYQKPERMGVVALFSRGFTITARSESLRDLSTK